MATAFHRLSPTQFCVLPEDKHDTLALEHLATLPSSSLAPLIPSLIVWLQDINWPVAEPVVKLLLQHPTLVVEPIREVLRGGDDPWKVNCLEYLVRKMRPDEKEKLRTEMERIMREPTDGETEEECDVVAGEILNSSRGYEAVHEA